MHPALIEQMISLSGGGVSRAKVLADKLRNALQEKRRQLAKQRTDRAQEYDRRTNDLLKQSVTGAWVSEIPPRPGAPPSSGQTAQGTPMMGTPVVHARTQNSAASTAGDQAASSPPASREDQVITGLITRYRYHRRQIPSRGLIAGAALMSGGVEAMLAQPLSEAVTGTVLPASLTLATLVGLAAIFAAVTSRSGPLDTRLARPHGGSHSAYW